MNVKVKKIKSKDSTSGEMEVCQIAPLNQNSSDMDATYKDGNRDSTTNNAAIVAPLNKDTNSDTDATNKDSTRNNGEIVAPLNKDTNSDTDATNKDSTRNNGEIVAPLNKDSISDNDETTNKDNTTNNGSGDDIICDSFSVIKECLETNKESHTVNVEDHTSGGDNSIDPVDVSYSESSFNISYDENEDPLLKSKNEKRKCTPKRRCFSKKRDSSGKKLSRGLRSDCPSFCRQGCTSEHHELLVCARRMFENDSKTTIVFLDQVNEYYKTKGDKNELIFDPSKQCSYPLLHYIALMGKCSGSFALVDSGHDPKTTLTSTGNNVLHSLVCEMYNFNCTHGHMDILFKKFKLLLNEFSSCLLCLNEKKQTCLHLCASLISTNSIFLSSRKPPFRYYQFLKNMFQSLIDQFLSSNHPKTLLNMVDDSGNTIAHYIANDRAAIDLLDLLKSHEIDLKIKNNDNETVESISKNAPDYPPEDILELAVFSNRSNKYKSKASIKPKYIPEPSLKVEKEIYRDPGKRKVKKRNFGNEFISISNDVKNFKTVPKSPKKKIKIEKTVTSTKSNITPSKSLEFSPAAKILKKFNLTGPEDNSNTLVGANNTSKLINITLAETKYTSKTIAKTDASVIVTDKTREATSNKDEHEIMNTDAKNTSIDNKDTYLDKKLSPTVSENTFIDSKNTSIEDQIPITLLKIIKPLELKESVSRIKLGHATTASTSSCAYSTKSIMSPVNAVSVSLAIPMLRHIKPKIVTNKKHKPYVKKNETKSKLDSFKPSMIDMDKFEPEKKTFTASSSQPLLPVIANVQSLKSTNEVADAISTFSAVQLRPVIPKIAKKSTLSVPDMSFTKRLLNTPESMANPQLLVRPNGHIMSVNLPNHPTNTLPYQLHPPLPRTAISSQIPIQPHIFVAPNGMRYMVPPSIPRMGPYYRQMSPAAMQNSIYPLNGAMNDMHNKFMTVISPPPHCNQSSPPNYTPLPPSNFSVQSSKDIYSQSEMQFPSPKNIQSKTNKHAQFSESLIAKTLSSTTRKDNKKSQNLEDRITQILKQSVSSDEIIRNNATDALGRLTSKIDESAPPVIILDNDDHFPVNSLQQQQNQPQKQQQKQLPQQQQALSSLALAISAKEVQQTISESEQAALTKHKHSNSNNNNNTSSKVLQCPSVESSQKCDIMNKEMNDTKMASLMKNYLQQKGAMPDFIKFSQSKKDQLCRQIENDKKQISVINEEILSIENFVVTTHNTIAVKEKEIKSCKSQIKSSQEQSKDLRIKRSDLIHRVTDLEKKVKTLKEQAVMVELNAV